MREQVWWRIGASEVSDYFPGALIYLATKSFGEWQERRMRRRPPRH